MRNIRAKKIRKSIYGDFYIKSNLRVYNIEEYKDMGTVTRISTGKRKQYLERKKQFKMLNRLEKTRI